MKLNEDLAEFIFRALFCLIFLGLGAEHIFSDELIQKLMPTWVPWPRFASLVCGLWLMAGGGLILLGWKLRVAAQALGVFLILVTIGVHLPGVMSHAPFVTEESAWLWDILQRTNLVKNICLLGVCFHLMYHTPGKYSLEAWLKRA